jgi:hypothetical protein
MRPSPAFAHHTLIYGSVGELLATAIPFVTEGLVAGQEAVLVCRSPLAREIVAEIGRDAPLRIIDPQQNTLVVREQHRWEAGDQADEMVRRRRHTPASREAQTG